jgi:hypothetical protein
MAKNQNRRIKPSHLTADENIFAALKAIDGYAPANPAYSIEALSATYTQLQSFWDIETQAEAALATARDNSVAKEWEFHNQLLGVKDQVRAQFGKDSNEVQALGLKKTSEYRPRRRKAQNNEGSSED